MKWLIEKKKDNKEKIKETELQTPELADKRVKRDELFDYFKQYEPSDSDSMVGGRFTDRYGVMKKKKYSSEPFCPDCDISLYWNGQNYLCLFCNKEVPIKIKQIIPKPTIERIGPIRYEPFAKSPADSYPADVLNYKKPKGTPEPEGTQPFSTWNTVYDY